MAGTGTASRGDAPRGEGLWASLRGRLGRGARGTGTEQRKPWRVEGMGGDQAPAGEPPRPTSMARFWWLLIGLLAVNWIIMSLLVGPSPRDAVSYTFFLQQVQGQNVAEGTSTGDSIEGMFKKAASYTPQGGSAEQVDGFITKSPTFADDDLFGQLQSAGARVNATPPDQGPPIWVQLLLGFGPTLLLVWLLLSF